MHLRKRVLVTGGAGFLGLLSLRAPARGRLRRHLLRQFLHRHQAQHRTPVEQPRIRADPPRHHLPALHRGRRDLQPGLPGLSDPLPERPRPDHQGERPRLDQHAGAGQAGQGPDPAGVDLRGLRRPLRAPPDRGLLGQRQLHRPALLLRRGQALRRDAVLRLPPPAQAGRPGGADLQHLRAAHAPQRRPGRQQLHHAGAHRPGHHGLRGRRADPLLLLRGRPDRRHVPDDEQPACLHRAGQPRQPARVHHSRARRKGDPAHRVALEDRVQTASHRRPDPAPPRHRTGPAEARLAAGHRPGTGLRRTIDYFKTFLPNHQA